MRVKDPDLRPQTESMKNENLMFAIIMALLASVFLVGFYFLPKNLEIISSEVEKITCYANRNKAIELFEKDPVKYRALDGDGDKIPCE